MDDLTIKVTADFGDVQNRFNDFLKSLKSYGSFPEVQTGIKNLTTDFQKLSNMYGNLDQQLSTSKGIREFIRQVNTVNTSSKGLTSTAKKSVASSDVTFGNIKEMDSDLTFDSKELVVSMTKLKSNLNAILIASKESEALKKVSDEVSKQDAKTAKVKQEVAVEEARLAEEEKKQVQKRRSTKNSADSVTVENQPAPTKTSLLNSTPEQLQQELALLTEENTMVGRLVSGFKELVGVIVEKNNLIRQEVSMIGTETQQVENLANASRNVSNNGNVAQNNANSNANANSNSTTSGDRKLLELNNYITATQNKLNDLRRSYGTFMDTANVQNMVRPFMSNLNSLTADPTQFNKTAQTNSFKAITSNIKNLAGQEGITNASAMYNKLIALIKEESNAKLKSYKLNGEDNGLMEQKLKLIQQQIAQLEGLLSKYNLLTKSQQESVNIERQKSTATYESGKAVLDKSLQSTGNEIDKSLVKPTNQFYSAFNKGEDGVISKLNNLQMRLYNIRYAFEGIVALAGGRKIYDWLIGTNAQIETLQKAMEVTMHSVEKAADTIQSLRSYAALTPFQETETFKAGETLSANRMDVMKWISISGDLAAAKGPQGIELNDVVNVVTRINSGDFGKAMIRLRQMGISLADFRAQGLQFSKNNTYLGTTEQMLDALEKIVKSRYGGMTEVLGNTVNGSISTIKDYFLQLGIDLGSGVFNQFSTALQKWKRELQNFRDSAEFQQIIDNFNKAFNTLKGFAGFGLGPLKSALSIIVGYLPEIATFIKLWASMKIIQGFLTGLDTLRANWIKLNLQQKEQNALIAQGADATILEDTATNRLYNTLARVVAMRKLGLKYADETAAADAMAAGTIQARGVNFAKNNFTKAANTVESEAIENGLAAGMASKQTAKAMESKLAAKSALAGVGAEAESAGVLAGATGLIGNVLMALPLILTLFGTIRQFFESPESKFTSDDYKRIASERMTESNRLGEVNIQRQTAKAQIDYYQNEIKNTSAEVQRTESVAGAKPNDNQAQQDYNNAVHANEEAIHNLTTAQQQLVSANQQLITIAPELARTLVDQKGALTDNTGAFEKNTETILDNIKQREYEIARQKEMEKQAALNEADKAQQQIDANNRQAGFSTSVGRAVGITGGIVLSLGKAVADLFGGSETLNEAVGGYKLAGLNAKDKQIALDSLNVDNNKQGEVISKATKLQQEENEARQHKFLLDNGKDINWNKYYDWKDKMSKASNQYLFEQEGVSTKAQDIQSSGDQQMEDIKNEYQVKLNELARKNGGKTDSQAYKDLAKKRDDAVRNAGQQVLDELESIKSLNTKMKSSLLTQAAGSKIQAITDLMQQHPDVTVKDIQNALTQLSLGTHTILTGKMHDYQGVLEAFYNNELGGDLENLNLYLDQIDRLEMLDNNNETINREINKAKLKMDSLTGDTGSQKSALQSFNDEWERKRQAAEDYKEIALQQQQMNQNYEGTQAYKNTRNDQDRQVRNIILQEISGLNKLLASGKLSEEDTWQARKQIADLQKEANNLALEIDDRLNKDALGAFHEKWDVPNEIEQAKRDLALQQDELNNNDSQSAKYQQDQKTLNMGLRDRLLNEASQLRDLIPKLDSKAQLEATLQQLNLQKEANQLLLDIKKNTDNFGEFNKPSFVKAMTYYDYMTQDSKSKSIEIGNADFVFKIDAPQTEQDVQNLMMLVQGALGQHVASSDRRGIVNPTTRG